MDDMTTRRIPPLPAASRQVASSPGQRKAERPFVIAQMGQSLDGRIATTSGESKYINGPYALDHLHVLRASVDAVVVGVGTVAADDPLLTVRRAPGRSPARVVLDPSGRADPHARCFHADGARRLVLRRAGAIGRLAQGVEEVILPGEGVFTPEAVLSALAAQGFARLLVEGGPRTLGTFLDAGCIDALHVFVSPVILGAGRIGLQRKECDSLADALRPDARVQVFPDGDVLFECDLRRADPRRGTRAGTGRDAREDPSDEALSGSPTAAALRAAG